MSNKGEKLLVAALDERWEAYRRQFKTCQQEFSEEAVHDLRVAARRFLGVLDIVRELVPQPHVQKTRRLFKDQLDELDELRDVQVMLVEVLESQPIVPQLEAVQPYLEKQEKSLMRTAHQRTKLSRLYGLQKRVDRVRATLMRQDKEVVSSSALLQAVDKAFARVWQDYERIDARTLATIHQTRVAFKKFRYVAEIISPLLPPPEPDYFRCMHDYQSAMGDIRDITVFLDALTDFGHTAESTAVAPPIRRYFRKNLRQLVSIFMKEKGELASFWRPTPVRPFPWERDQHAGQRSGASGSHRIRQSRMQVEASARSKPAAKAPGEINGPRASKDTTGPQASAPRPAYQGNQVSELATPPTKE